MLFTVREDLDLCKEYKINPAQLMFVKMLVKDPAYERSDWKKESYKMALEYQDVIGGISAEDLLDLVARDIIVDFNDFGKTHLDYYEIHPQFVGDFNTKVYPMPAELTDNYPGTFKIDGKSYIGKNVSQYDIANEYLKAINKDPEEHRRVLDDLKWAIKNNAIGCGLKKFVYTRYWEIIRNQRSKHDNNISDVKIL